MFPNGVSSLQVFRQQFCINFSSLLQATYPAYLSFDYYGGVYWRIQIKNFACNFLCLSVTSSILVPKSALMCKMQNNIVNILNLFGFRVVTAYDKRVP